MAGLDHPELGVAEIQAITVTGGHRLALRVGDAAVGMIGRDG